MDIIKSPNRSLAYLSSVEGDVKVKAMLTLLISETLDFFSISNSMGASQIAQTVDLILEDYSVYKPDYFVLCFNRAKKGNYGKSYNRIDGQIIFEWLAAFDAEFTKEAEQMRLKEKKQAESDVIHLGASSILPPPEQRPIPMPDYVKDLIKNIGAKKPSIEIKKHEPTKEQILINGYIKDFETIYGVDMTPGPRFITVNGKKMDKTEYLQYRLLKDIDDNENKPQV